MLNPSDMTPEAVLEFWLGRLRSAADASRENWRDRMVRWRVGVFARGAEDTEFFEYQREWCEKIHQKGIDGFFSDVAWSTPNGMLAKLIVLDQFPRSVYRGTPLAYVNDNITGQIALELCELEWDLTKYNVIERFWVYVAMSHPEELSLQELCVRKSIRWSEDLVAEVSSGRRKINQYISWYFIKAFIEHSDALVIFSRFPHRNAILSRVHKVGEPQYLTGPVRPLWSYTQPPQPHYYAILACLYRIDTALDENRILPATVSELQKLSHVKPDEEDSLLDVFDLVKGETVTYLELYRHLVQKSKTSTYRAICATTTVDELFHQIKAFILADPSDSWPPRSAKRSVNPVIDVTAMLDVIQQRESGKSDLDPPQKSELEDSQGVHRVDLMNDVSELENLTKQVDEFAELRGFDEGDLFEIQLAIEEWVMNTINYGFNDAAEHEITVFLGFDEETSTFKAEIVDDGEQFDPLAETPEVDIDSFAEDRVEGNGVGVQLLLRFADKVEYRREGMLNHLTLIKQVAVDEPLILQ